jgi:hypothetical protein
MILRCVAAPFTRCVCACVSLAIEYSDLLLCDAQSFGKWFADVSKEHIYLNLYVRE